MKNHDMQTGPENNKFAQKEGISMKKVFLFVALLGFITMFISCAVVNEQTLKESGAKLLNQQDLIEFFKQERAVTWTSKQVSGKSYYFPNGTQEMTWPGGGDKGEYRLENGQFCSKWKEWRGGKEKCLRLYKTGENEYSWVHLDGSFNSAMTLIK